MTPPPAEAWASLAWRLPRLVLRALEPGSRPAPEAPLAPTDFRRVLLQAPNWLGDAVMALPLFEHLRRSCPAAEVAVACRPGHSALWALAGASEILELDRFDPQLTVGDLRRFVAAVRRGRFDAVVLAAYGFEFALLHASARVPVRIGFPSDHRRRLLTHVVADGDAAHVHNIERTLALGRAFGAPAHSRPRLPLPAVETRTGRARVVFHPFAVNGRAKRWPPAQFAALGQRIVSAHDADVILIGNAAEQREAAAIQAAMNGRAIDRTGRTSIAELCAEIAGATLVVANDSGPAHLADALGVPLITLFLSTSPARTAPRGPRSRVVGNALECSPCLQRTCPLGTYACHEAVSVDRVYAAVAAMLP